MNGDMTITWVLLLLFALAGYLWMRDQGHILDRKYGKDRGDGHPGERIHFRAGRPATTAI